VRLLLDTHALLWALTGAPELGRKARGVIAAPQNDVLVSVVSLWEIVVKRHAGKLTASLGAILGALAPAGYHILPIETRHLLALDALPAFHRDPFDHLLIAQAIADQLTFVTEDDRAPLYGVTHLRCSA
jgi:PIN domain nuclease of toxin-antitoxin system